MFWHSFKRKKLRTQLVLIYLCIIIPVVLLFSTIMLSSFFRQLHDSAVNKMLNKSYHAQLYVMRYFSQAAHADSSTILKKTAPYFVSQLSNMSGLDVELYTPSEMLAGSAKQSMPSFTSADIQEAFETKSYTFVRTGRREILSFSSPIYDADGQTVGVIRMLFPMDEEYRQLGNMILIMCILSAAALLLTFVTGFMFSSEITRPLDILRDKVNCMKDGNFRQRIPSLDNAEMDDLGSAFNLMCERLGEYIGILGSRQQQQQQFFNNATHQLKTPLTSIIGYSQMIQLNSDNDRVCEDAFIIEEAGEKLLHSIETLLEESQAGTIRQPLQYSTFRLKGMVLESIALLKPRLKKGGIAVEIMIAENVKLNTDRTTAQEVVLAILDNAILHSSCTKIRFWCRQSETGEIRLSIGDNGNGIPVEDIPYIFKAFYRSTKATVSGNGLGLSVCENFMRRLGGSIFVESGEGVGTEFILKFPLPA